MKDEYIEIELTNGNRVLFQNDWEKVYDMQEKTKCAVKLTWKFPFLKFFKKRFTSFKFRTCYETMNSWWDPRYNVNCTLIKLAKLFGTYVKPFELNVVEDDMNVFH